MWPFIKKTNFKPSGVILDGTYRAPRFTLPAKYSVPSYIDGLSYFTPIDNQEAKPWCMAYSVCNFIERRQWQLTGVCTQLNPEPLYLEAKRLDGNNSPGTTAQSIIRATYNLRYVSPDTPVQYLDNAEEYRFALHKFGAAICLFLITEGWNSCSRTTGNIGDSELTLGGHAVCGGYYDNNTTGGPNEWGLGWGWNGFWRMTWAQFYKQFDSGFVFDIQE